MKPTFSSLKRDLARLAVLGLAVEGCDPVSPRLETEEIRRANTTANAAQLPPAYRNSQDRINDPRLLELAERFKEWALKQRAGASQAAIFGGAEVLPPTQTVLPYGVGAFQQEPRLPAILTTGPGWAELKPDEKEARVAAAFGELSGRLDALKLNPSPRPTLTLQMPSGLVLGWINDLSGGGKNLHGEEQ